MDKTSKAAAALGKLRWKDVSKADRKQAMAELGRRSAAALTPEQRKARALKAVATREARRKAKQAEG